MEEYKEKARAAVQETLKHEITPIYSQNVKDFQVLRDKWLNKYRQARRDPEEYEIPQSPTGTINSPCSYTGDVFECESQALEYLAQVGYKNLTVDDLTRYGTSVERTQ